MENINEENNNDQDNTDETAEHDIVQDETLISEQPDTAFDEQPDTAFNYAPPPAAPPQVEDRLIRDPHTFFGGVLSGIAHRYGFDVALTRLVFVLLTFFTAGTTIPIYLLSWIVIPRARFWPPVVRARTRALSGRDMGFGLIGLAVFVALAIGTGDAAAVIVPLGLIIGGVWLLVQAPRNEMAFAGTPVGENLAGGSSAPFAPAYGAAGSAGPATTQMPLTTAQMPSLAPAPVEPRSRKRRFAIFAAIGAVLLIPVLLVGGIFAAILFGDWNIDLDETVTVIPVGVDDVPRSVFQESGEYILDLRNTDLSPLDESGAEPLDVAIEVDVGKIEVLLPAGLDVQIDADVNAIGDVTVFNNNDDGIEPGLRVTSDDPQLILDLDVELGAIEVSRP